MAAISELSTYSTVGADAGSMLLRGKPEWDTIALDVFSLATLGAGQSVSAAYRFRKLDKASRNMLNAGLHYLGGAAGLGGVADDYMEWLSGERYRQPGEWVYCPDGNGPSGSGRTLM